MKNWSLVTAAPLIQRSSGARKTTIQQTNSMSGEMSEKRTFSGKTPASDLSCSCLETIDSHSPIFFKKILTDTFVKSCRDNFDCLFPGVNKKIAPGTKKEKVSR